MRRVALPLLLLVPACALPAQVEPPSPRVYDLILFRQAPYAQLTVGGAKGLFLVDTGANTSGVDETWLRTSGVRYEDAGRSSVGGTTGAIETGRVVFERIDLGNGFFLKPTFLLQSYAHFAHPDEGAQAGLLGTDLLGRYQIDLDYASRRLEVSLRDERPPPPEGFEAVPVEFPLGLPTVRVDVAGVGIPCRLDSGASYIDPEAFLDVNRAAFEAIRASGVPLEKTGEIHVVGISGPESLPLYRGTGEDGLVLRIGRRRIAGVVLVVHDRGVLAVPEPIALAPASILSRLGRFVLDPFDSRFWTRSAG